MASPTNVTRSANVIHIGFADFPLARTVPPDEAWIKTYDVVLGDKPFTIYGVDFFFGHDRGDSFEMGVEIGTPDGRFIARRIEESEVTNREASKLVLCPVPVRAADITASVICRVTGESHIDLPEHPSYRSRPGWRATFDLNLILIGAP